jgi:acetoin utilization deacetylase AcuC-like enzyme
VFYQAGVDVLAGDRFGKLALTMQGVAERDRLVCDFACRAGLPLVVTLGGGYARDINQIVEAHCQTVKSCHILQRRLLERHMRHDLDNFKHLNAHYQKKP